MPTLPLISDSPPPDAIGSSGAHLDAPHRITAPGGYESWRFDASSDDGRLHLVAELHATDALDPAYLRRYAAFMRRPTRRTPPAPGDYPAVAFGLYEQERKPVRFIARSTADGFQVADDGRTIRLGGCHVARSDDGMMRLHFRGMIGIRTVTANLSFQPTLSSVLGLSRVEGTREVDLVPPVDGCPRHRWHVADPLCDVNGEVSIFDTAGKAPRIIAFAGGGYHEHRYGTRPLLDAANEWFSGRVLMDDRVVAFQVVGSEPAHLYMVGKDASGKVTAQATQVEVERIGSDTIRIGPLQLDRSIVLDSGGGETMLTYHATVDGEEGIALCRRIHARRLSRLLMNPFAGRLRR